MAANPNAQEVPPNADIQLIVDFVEANHPKMWEAVEQKGGWEGWAQSEFASFLVEHSPSNYVSEREQYIYKNKSQRIDIWAEPMDNSAPMMGIELKCEGQYQDLKWGDFTARVVEDIKKIRGGLKSESTQHNGAKVYAVGLTTNPNDLKGFDEVARYGEQVYFSRHPANMLFIIWWVKSFPKV